MKPWDVLGRATAPDGTALTLLRHPSEYIIQADGETLMTSRAFSSEAELAVLGCAVARARKSPRVLIGGLGMGFTLRAALDVLPADARVVVAELVPEVLEWNRTILGELAGEPLRDARVTVEIGDVTTLLRSRPASFDAVLLDVDNGPEALTASTNMRLYDDAGVATIRASLTPGGVVAVWSAGVGDRRFERRLRAAGFSARRVQVHAHARGGRRYGILLGTLTDR